MSRASLRSMIVVASTRPLVTSTVDDGHRGLHHEAVDPALQIHRHPRQLGAHRDLGRHPGRVDADGREVLVGVGQLEPDDLGELADAPLDPGQALVDLLPRAPPATAAPATARNGRQPGPLCAGRDVPGATGTAGASSRRYRCTGGDGGPDAGLITGRDPEHHGRIRAHPSPMDKIAPWWDSRGNRGSASDRDTLGGRHNQSSIHSLVAAVFVRVPPHARCIRSIGRTAGRSGRR